jgi:hypothetical protein
VSDSEWNYFSEPDGYGGVRYGRVKKPGPIDPNVLWYPVGLFVLIAICAAVLKTFEFLAAYSGYLYFMVIPALALLGVIQYPVVRIADKIRRVRYPDHRFLRRWFKVSAVMIMLAIGYPALMLALGAVLNAAHAAQWIQSMVH